MMTDFTELFRRHGTPLPNAVTMETEVRSEGALAFQTVNIPPWAKDVKSSSSLAEWSCLLPASALLELQDFLRKPSPASGKVTEQIINEAMVALDIGYYLGTFIEEDILVAGSATIHVLFSHRSDPPKTMEAMNKALYTLLSTPTADQKEASDLLKQLRVFWAAGTNKNEYGLMLLSEILPLYDPERFPFTAAVTP